MTGKGSFDCILLGSSDHLYQLFNSKWRRLLFVAQSAIARWAANNNSIAYWLFAAQAGDCQLGDK